jgi:hypothetical protein
MDAGPEERAGLRRIQNCRKLEWIFLLGIAPIAYIASRISEAAFIVALLLWVSATFAVGLRHYRSRCPRCGKLFNVTNYRHVWASECVHCGLSLGGGWL